MAQQNIVVNGNGNLNYVGSDNITYTLTGNGAIKYTTGHVAGQQAYYNEEGTTNLLPNPSVETNTTGWVPNANTTMGRFQGGTSGYIGSLWMNFSCPDTSDWEGVEINSVTLNHAGARTYIGSAYLKRGYNGTVGTSLAIFIVRVHYTDGTTEDSAGKSLNLLTTWQRFTTNPITTNASKTVSYVRLIACRNTAAVETTTMSFDMDAAMIEEKGYVTTYTDGSLGTGYSWSGTAHASTSTRTAAYAAYPTGNNVFPSFPFEIHFKYNEIGASVNVNGGWAWIVGNWENGFLGMTRANDGKWFIWYWNDSGTQGINPVAPSALSAGWHTVGMYMDSTVIELIIDGVVVTSVSGTFTKPDFTGKNGWLIGGDSYQNLNAPLGPLQVFLAKQNQPTRAALVNNTNLWSMNMALPQATGTRAFFVGV